MARYPMKTKAENETARVPDDVCAGGRKRNHQKETLIYIIYTFIYRNNVPLQPLPIDFAASALILPNPPRWRPDAVLPCTALSIPHYVEASHSHPGGRRVNVPAIVMIFTKFQVIFSDISGNVPYLMVAYNFAVYLHWCLSLNWCSGHLRFLTIRIVSFKY